MNKKLSIITVVYNGEKYIEDAIKSVLSEKNDEIEYIIIDGASKDATLSIIEKYKRDIDIIISEPDKGIYDAMNKGGKLASGDYIVFLNSDDYYKNGLLSSFLKVVNNNSDAIIMNTYIKSGGIEKKFNRVDRKNDYKLYLQIPFMHPSIAVKRSIFNKIGGFDLQYKIASDCDFLMKMLLEFSNFTYIDDGVVMRAGGVSDSCFKEGRKEYKKIYAQHSGKKIGAWLGYCESIFFYNLYKIRRIFK